VKGKRPKEQPNVRQLTQVVESIKIRSVKTKVEDGKMWDDKGYLETPSTGPPLTIKNGRRGNAYEVLFTLHLLTI
jgi:hypothetical protein